MADDLAKMDATAQAELVRSGAVSPRELVDAAIERVEKFNPQLNAVIRPRYEKARAEADSASLPDGPLKGVPFLLKDLFCVHEGDEIHSGCKALKAANYTAPHSTYLADKFRASGLVTVGQTNTPEFGFATTTEPEAYGPSRNPWNTNHSTGGSSGGSAAAVAARLVPVAHANDGGGSIRIPASACGLVGLKPSRGRLSLGAGIMAKPGPAVLPKGWSACRCGTRPPCLMPPPALCRATRMPRRRVKARLPRPPGVSPARSASA